jgi:xylulokinase
MAALRGIGLSGQMHGATLLDGAHRVLRPCILWNDTRAAAEAAGLDADPDARAISGNIVFPGFTAPKLLWVEAHEPEVFERVATVLLPKDYLRLWLTGEAASEMSDAAGTAWFDLAGRRWSDRLLGLGHMSRGQMPPLVEGTEATGALRADLCARWGIARPPVVVGGGGDNAAAACGAGCLREGDAFVSLGTSGVLLVARDAARPAPETAVHTFCHALPGRWYQMGVILAATDCLTWLSKIAGRSQAELAATLPDRIAGPQGALFLPYLSGERTPHNDSAIRGVFAGLDIAGDATTLAAAVMEGVAFALRDSLDALRATGAAPDRLLVTGGGSRARFWVETLATVLDLPVDLPEGAEFGAALGAARLALAGDTGAAPDDVMTRPALAETVAPRRDLTAAYCDAQARFRALYPNVKAALA